MEISKVLRIHSRTLLGKEQLFTSAYAKALEVIPRQLCDNAGFDSTEALNKLRQKHAMEEGGRNFGINIDDGGVVDTYASFVWEPIIVKKNALQAATEAACLILSVDETVKNPESEQNQGMGRGGGGMGRGGMGGMRGRGRGMMRR